MVILIRAPIRRLQNRVLGIPPQLDIDLAPFRLEETGGSQPFSSLACLLLYKRDVSRIAMKEKAD